jgi:hypothetical protein
MHYNDPYVPARCYSEDCRLLLIRSFFVRLLLQLIHLILFPERFQVTVTVSSYSYCQRLFPR